MTAFDVAQRFMDVPEEPGPESNPLVLAMLRLDAKWVEDDSTPWCAAFVGFIAWLLGMPRSKSLAARSWLKVGTPIGLSEAKRGNDIVILKRGTNPAQGHVGFFAGMSPHAGRVLVLGGNQSDQVSIAPFLVADIVGVRRLA